MRRKTLLGVFIFLLLETFVVARRRGSVFGIDTIVRCRHGHLFTTFWIPGASLKSLKLGWWRYQFCPVGPHWSLVTPVQVSELSEDERRLAAEHHDIRLP